MTTTLIGRLAKLDGEIAEHVDKITKLKAKRVTLAEQVLDYMSRHGIQNQNVKEHGRTVFLYETLSATKAKEISNIAFVDLCRENGFEDIAGYSHGRLSELIREWDTEEEPIPKWLEPHVNVFLKQSVRSNKTAAKNKGGSIRNGLKSAA